MKAIILDRDGVINEDSIHYIKSPEEVIFTPGSLEAIAKLSQAGFTVFVASNQSGVGLGLYDLTMLDKIHKKIFAHAEKVGGKIEKIYFCPHTDDDHCDCRKPKPGLLLQIAKDNNLDLSKVFFVGDSYRDIEAGLEAGCPSILVKTGNGEKTVAEHPDINKIAKVCDDLAQAADWLEKNQIF